jgi:ring-1,2-phenylacetyl-CoA epoxidase subunit PaaB
VKVYEVFLKRPGRDPFTHAGSLEAPDDEIAYVLARETYARRGEGEEMWLVAREHIVELDAEWLAPNADKPHRHNDGALVAGRRKASRERT